MASGAGTSHEPATLRAGILQRDLFRDWQAHPMIADRQSADDLNEIVASLRSQ
jgi:hypothetical protein